MSVVDKKQQWQVINNHWAKLTVLQSYLGFRKQTDKHHKIVIYVYGSLEVIVFIQPPIT